MKLCLIFSKNLFLVNPCKTQLNSIIGSDLYSIRPFSSQPFATNIDISCHGFVDIISYSLLILSYLDSQISYMKALEAKKKKKKRNSNVGHECVMTQETAENKPTEMQVEKGKCF